MNIRRKFIPVLLFLLLYPLGASAESALVVGVFPRRNATQTSQMFTPLAEYLGRQLHRRVELVTAKDFPAFWEGVEQQKYDVVHYNQYHYVESADKYTVVACNEEQGKGDIAGALYVRRDSGIEQIEQLRGKKVIFGGGQDAMMSYIVPRYLLQQAGLGDGDYETVFASNPLNAILAVHFRQVDAGGGGDVVMHLPKVKSLNKENDLKYLAVSERIKHLPWAVRRDLPASLREQIQGLLVNLGEAEEGRAILKSAGLTAFRPAKDEDYNRVREIAQQVMPHQ